MKRKAMLAAALGLLVVGCQSEFERCVEIGTASNMEFGRLSGDKENLRILAKDDAWRTCAGRRK